MGYPPVTGGFASQRASNAGNVSIWWRHYELDESADIGSELYNFSEIWNTSRIGWYSQITIHWVKRFCSAYKVKEYKY